MAVQQIQTNEGAGESDDLEIWLKKNKLTKVRAKFIEDEVSLDDLRELAAVSSPDQLMLIYTNIPTYTYLFLMHES